MFGYIARAWQYLRSSPEVRRYRRDERDRRITLEFLLRHGVLFDLPCKVTQALMPPIDNPLEIERRDREYKRFLKYVAEFDRWYAKHVPQDPLPQPAAPKE